MIRKKTSTQYSHSIDQTTRKPQTLQFLFCEDNPHNFTSQNSLEFKDLRTQICFSS